MISDFVDVINSDRITGWCFNNEDPQTAVTMVFYADERRLGETLAERPRPDLKAVGFHPTGNCGFEFTLPDDVDLSAYANLTIRVDGATGPVKTYNTRSIQRVFRTGSKRIFFMHVPKTAGTSFNTFAETVFPEGSTAIHIESLDPAQYPGLAESRSYLAGHLPLRDIKTGFDLTHFDLITILREPWSHLHSHLNWVKNIGADPQSDFFRAHSTETRELALLLNRLDFNRPENLDLLVDGICGDLTSLFDNHQTRYFLDYRRTRVSQEDVAMASDELRHFKLVGKTEQYREFIERFCDAYGIDLGESTQQLNVARGQKIFDYSQPEVRDRLMPFVKYDLQLYDLI